LALFWCQSMPIRNRIWIGIKTMLIHNAVSEYIYLLNVCTLYSVPVPLNYDSDRGWFLFFTEIPVFHTAVMSHFRWVFLLVCITDIVKLISSWPMIKKTCFLMLLLLPVVQYLTFLFEISRKFNVFLYVKL
jgi:hypothetical protein